MLFPCFFCFVFFFLFISLFYFLVSFCLFSVLCACLIQLICLFFSFCFPFSVLFLLLFFFLLFFILFSFLLAHISSPCVSFLASCHWDFSRVWWCTRCICSRVSFCCGVPACCMRRAAIRSACDMTPNTTNWRSTCARRRTSTYAFLFSRALFFCFSLSYNELTKARFTRVLFPFSLFCFSPLLSSSLLFLLYVFRMFPTKQNTTE